MNYYLIICTGDKLSESATLPKMAVHTGNTFTIFSDSPFPKVNAAVVSSVGNVSTSHTTIANAKLSNSAVQFASGEYFAYNLWFLNKYETKLADEPL